MSSSVTSSPTRKFWKWFLYVLLFIPVFFILVNFGILGSMPDIEELENPKSAIASELYSEDGVLMGQYYIQKRSTLGYNDIPKQMFDALISTEDERFYEHSGIDLKRFVGAVVALGSSGGASTITQQLAKNLFLSGERTVVRKGQELVLTWMLEGLLSKRRILEIYLNSVEWGEGVFGAQAAAQHYFRVDAAQLSPSAAARLAVMLPAPKRFEKRPTSDYLAQRTQSIMARMGGVELP